MTIQARLETLEKKHGALEEELHLALNHPSSNDTTISDIKRRKLRLKDEIERLRGEMSEPNTMELN
ncbi:MAG: DUF465 domain-containing protein [Hyphomicrobiales bacterium]|nr:DUF465 domain-containing protein [Hyphomicrobiales bacterium]MCP4999561.1 DUF465 domain-containing protein [Hyphomicrobiales bacterium]